jgi:hypothetical protein
MGDSEGGREGTVSQFIRNFRVTPAYDTKAEGYGIGCAMLWFELVGPKGAMVFHLLTNWYLPQNERDTRCRPFLGGVDYHSPAPLRDWQSSDEPSQKECNFLCGKPCWSDGSSLAAERVFEIMVSEGSDGVWKFLEDRYVATFEDGSK